MTLASAVWIAATARFVAGAERTTGTVVDLRESRFRNEDGFEETSYFPIVTFTTPEGRAVRFESSTTNDSYDIGDRVDVLYDPDDPSDARLAALVDLWLFPVLFVLVGLGLAAVGGFLAIRRARKLSGDDAQWLRRFGRRLEGRSPKVRGSEPYYLEVEIHEPMKEPRVVASDFVWFNPARQVRKRESIDVYVDPNDDDRYYVDLSFLRGPEGAVLASHSVRPPL